MSEYQRFLQDKGELLRYDYNLNENSVVMDVGGYQGEFANNIFKKFGCYVCIFEPVFFKDLFERFVDNDKIYIHDYGLSNKTGTKSISINVDSTSLHRVFSTYEKAQFMDIYKFMQSEKQIDLIKINIEGEEYNLLDRMIETGIIDRFVNIQVQFHEFVPNAEKRKTKIQAELLKTHDLMWSYDFIWESWRLKCQ